MEVWFLIGGGVKSQFAHLPRVQYKNVILSPESWTVKIEEIKSLFKIKDDNQLVSDAEKWRNEKLIPTHVVMVDDDNELFVDWNNALSIRSFFSSVKQRQEITLDEFLFEPENAVVKDKTGGVYCNEIIVAFYKSGK